MFDTLQFVDDSRQIQLTWQLDVSATHRQTKVYRTYELVAKESSEQPAGERVTTPG